MFLAMKFLDIMTNNNATVQELQDEFALAIHAFQVLNGQPPLAKLEVVTAPKTDLKPEIIERPDFELPITPVAPITAPPTQIFDASNPEHEQMLRDALKIAGLDLRKSADRERATAVKHALVGQKLDALNHLVSEFLKPIVSTTTPPPTNNTLVPF